MNEAEFGYRIRQVLNEGTERLDYRAVYRLERARQAALARHRTPAEVARRWVPALEPAPSEGPQAAGGPWAWLRGAGLAAPLVALVVGFVGIYQWHHAQHIADLADIDFAVLLDEHPIETYADGGFGLFLQSEAQP
jgi:hypothetical protein